ncbi:TenA family protein [Acetobacteraceae bacterium KSS8]|uniref:Aminopyrimidine aminohydrolase n=1 Tax=Endosaccharibacter trunci TaxID=2812733 RepID=A0ABT1W2C5_9PROT|nr:TenA family protein [Acetobacteraceae bacterium KSS8]
MTERYSEQLRALSEPDWSAATEHRFVRELCAGTIAPGPMRRYLIQDHRFLDSFLRLLGAAIATADTMEARLRFGRSAGVVSGEENTYFLRAFASLGVGAERDTDPDSAPTAGFKALMREAAESGSYPAVLSVLCVAEWLYLDWAMRAPRPLPADFVHAEWITLHDNPDFRQFVSVLRSELDRVGPGSDAECRDVFRRAVALERQFLDDAYA